MAENKYFVSSGDYFMDLKTWERRKIFEVFNHAMQPHFSLNIPIDISKLYHYCHEQGISVNMALIFAVSLAMNEIDEFRTRLVARKKVVAYKRIHPAFTHLKDNQILFLYKDFNPDLIEFIKAEPKESDDATEKRQDFAYFSVIPWFPFTSCTHVMRSRHDSIPRFAWDKFSRDNNKVTINLSLQMHHALVDGYHIGKLHGRLIELIENPLR